MHIGILVIYIPVYTIVTVFRPLISVLTELPQQLRMDTVWIRCLPAASCKTTIQYVSFLS